MIQGVRNDIYNLMNQGVMHHGQNLSLYFSRLCKEIDDPSRTERGAKEFAIKRLESGLSKEAFKLYDRAYNNWRKAWENNSNALCFEMATRTPLIVGMGDQNIHEFGLSFQHPWGTPYIPGSAIKGVASMYAQQSGDADWQRNLKNAEPDGQYAEAVFGGVNSENKRTAGGIGFADAWWIPECKHPFQTDIIDVHYRTYYQGIDGAWPDGTDAPLPVKFIAIRPGMRFLIVLSGDANWCRVVKQIVRAAAEERGFGAKTRVGYGRMKYLESVKELLARLDSMDTGELANLFRAKGNQTNYNNFFLQAVRRHDCNPELYNLFQIFRPAALLLKQLQETRPRDLRAARNIRNNFSERLKANQINTSDADIQAIFNFCLPLATNGVPGTWLEAFAYGFDDMVQEKSFDEIASVLINHLDNLNKGLTNWPTLERIRQDIKLLPSLTAKQLMELEAYVDMES
ncbi:MAG: type III-B CRISPR module RAMP protein Cmr6 [Deltaproteobacteria bacterium]|nr:type III-B CRISPR module RAMP protein Cmr6 [Deltaproteobacteria bacterium]